MATAGCPNVGKWLQAEVRTTSQLRPLYPQVPTFAISAMTRPTRRRYTTTMRYLIAALALLPNIAQADITGPAKVIDGDTIEVAGQRIRLFGASSNR